MVSSRHEYVLYDFNIHDPFGLFYVAVGDPAGAVVATEAICDAMGAVTAQGTTIWVEMASSNLSGHHSCRIHTGVLGKNILGDTNLVENHNV